MYMVAMELSVAGVRRFRSWIRGRTAAGSDQSGVVGVEHDLGARALSFNLLSAF
jgi:hypothetical protein